MTELDTGGVQNSGESQSFAFIPAPWSPGRALWLLVFVFAVSATGSIVARAIVAKNLGDALSSALVGLVLVAGYVAELFVVFLVARSHGVGLSASIGLIRPQRARAWAWVALAIVGAVSARGFASLYAELMQLLPINLPGADTNPLSLFPGGSFSLIILFLVVVVIAPFTEEVVFRGVLLPAFGARWGAVAGILMSSALFAGLHFSAYVFAPIAVAALVFGSLFVGFRSLWPAYLAHATFNGVAVVLLLVLQAQGLV